MTLEVLGETAAPTDPSESAFDDPAFGKNDEAMQLVAFDDLDLPRPGLCDSRGEFRSLIAGIGEDALDEWEHATRAAVEYQARSIAILHVGGMDDDVQQEAERVDENVALATRDLLACVIARRIERRPPFCAPLALCASMIATVGLASCPACARTAR